MVQREQTVQDRTEQYRPLSCILLRNARDGEMDRRQHNVEGLIRETASLLVLAAGSRLEHHFVMARFLSMESQVSLDDGAYLSFTGTSASNRVFKTLHQFGK